ncbi:N-acetylglucosamine-1-phosphate uridyltransferase / Glucosamine-1-phosphate N-acetyltransferase [hydrothermal vent metagenome]|uniref:N-acetylglucosamine-1-phosphate uridyltransferase / Glucosamine-1-phosphate N-acetyltransferase n=1 Tax=hydrothermal vent metagenome TaxID=652676 RepID=A0A3B0RGA4_9ZZZZ
MPKQRAAIILAAGHGSRMKSDLPKVLHKVGGRSMFDWLVALVREAGAARIAAIVGTQTPLVKQAAINALGGGGVAIQDPPNGTGHATACASEVLAGFDGNALVVFADSPLITPATIERVFAALDAGAAVAVLGFEPDVPGAYGRLVENATGDLLQIVEAKDASAEQLAIGLCNSGVVATDAKLLFELLSEVTNDNANGEYYLTDIVALAVARGLTAKAVRASEEEVLGVNSRTELAMAEQIFQSRARQQALDAGVGLLAPETVFFSFDTELEADVVVEPNVVFGPGVSVKSGALIRAFSYLEGARVNEDTVIGPYARLRPGTLVKGGAKIGNFVEVKKTTVREGAKISHLSYIGDADVGANANIGAGTITCNYDGFDKYRTEIGEGAFIGSNTALVAPVSIGDGAIIGAGSVITKRVPADAMAVARGKQKIIDGWAVGFRNKKKKS